MPTLDTALFEQWNKHLAAIAATSDPTELPGLLMDALSSLIKADNFTTVVFSENRKPMNLIERSFDVWPEDDIKIYMEGAYLLDPFYRAGIERVEPGLYHMDELAPAAFHDSEYFNTYYAPSPVEEEIGFIIYLSDDCFTNLSFSRSKGAAPFNNQEIGRIRAPLPLVESLLVHYWAAVSAESGQPGSDLHSQLEDALSIFSTSVLTPREAEVMRMYLYGHDTRSISERLKISTHTVSAHRKHAYARLDITSQAELFSLFINSMYCFDGDPAKDPLENYLNTPASADSPAQS